MRQLQQVYMQKKDGAENKAPKNGIELQQMPDLTGDSSVEFSDWLYLAEQVVGSLTDNASTWFNLNLVCAQKAYSKFQTSTPMARPSIAPVRPPELRDGKWSRLERRVSSMLLSSMPKAAKEDAVTHRLNDVASMLYRLHVLYQPGGNAERAAILRHLDGQLGNDNFGETVAQLRRWRRYLARAQEMGLSLPDPSLQLKGIDLITAKVLEKNGEINFRLALARNELQLQGRPTQETILKYYDHALAELQQAAPARPSKTSMPDSLKLKAIGGSSANTPEGTSPTTSSPTRGRTPCKFFTSDNGCRSGAGCQYSHEYASKEDKRSRCWTCGSKQHRQGDCAVKDPSKAKSGRGEATAKAAAMLSTPTPSATSQSPAGLAPSSVGAQSGSGSLLSLPATTTSTSTAPSEAPLVLQPSESQREQSPRSSRTRRTICRDNYKHWNGKAKMRGHGRRTYPLL